MRWKTTLALLAITVGIGAYVSLYELRQPSPEERAQRSKHIIKVDPERATQLVLDLPQATLTLVRQPNAGWTIAPQRFRADDAQVESLLHLLAPLTAERVLTEPAEQPLDVKAFGLDPALGSMSVVEDSAPMTLWLGETTPVGGHRYAKLTGRSEVFVISSRLFDEANRPLEQFRDRTLLRVDPWQADTLTVTTPAASYQLLRTDNTWRIAYATRVPIDDVADRTAVNGLLAALGAITIARFTDDAPQVERLAEWGFDHPAGELALTYGGPAKRTTTIFFGNPLPDDASLRYAKRDDEPPVYAVPASALEGVMKPPDAVRSKACFEFFTNNVHKVEVVSGTSRWTIERTEGRWREAEGGEALDALRVEEWLNQLSNARVSSFMEAASGAGLGATESSITIWTTDHPDQPQRLRVGAAGQDPARRSGRLEPRGVLVELPEATAALAQTPLQQLHPSAPVPQPSPNIPEH